MKPLSLLTQRTSDTSGIIHRARSHWFDTSTAYVPAAPLQSDVRVDCCVIGGGVTGLSAAYHLKEMEPGANIALLEAEVVGYGASGRNAGQLLVTFGRGDFPGLVRRYGEEEIGAAWTYTHDGIKMIERLQAQEGIDCDYAATGYIQASLRVEGEAQLDRHLKLIERIGHGASYTYLDVRQMESELASPYLGAGIYDRRGGQFNPLKWVRGLKQAAERRGVQVFEYSPVAHVQIEPGQIVVHCGTGSVRCDKLVLATNAYTHLVEGLRDLGMAREQTPLMVKATITQPLAQERWAAAKWPRRCGVNVLSQLFYSFAPTVDGRLLYVGGYYTSAPSDRALAPEVEWRLKREGPRHLAAFFPALEGVAVSQTWGGPISITADSVPHVGQSKDPRIFYACGCWGHGMAIGTHNGRTIAELAWGKRTASTDLWFVQRRKSSWPGRTMAGLLATRVIAHRRRGNRKIGEAMQPPLQFEV